MATQSKKIKNLALISHGGAGKTTLTENILYNCGVTDDLGKVEDGNTKSDFLPEEIEIYLKYGYQGIVVVNQIVEEITAEYKDEPLLNNIDNILDKIEKTSIKTNGDEIKLKEYTANTIDEVVFSSLQAEKDGATALICAPTISSTIENIIDIPVVTIMPKSSINKAVEIATKKIKNR